MDVLWDCQKRVLHAPQMSNAVFLPYGSGKTRVALLRMRKLLLNNQSTLCMGLVFIRKHNRAGWKREIDKVFPGEDIQVIDETNYKNWEPSARRPAIILWGHHNADRHLDWLLTDVIHGSRPEIVIVDESTRIKNSKTKTTKAILKIGSVAQTEYQSELMIMTGDPCPESPTEIWSQFQFLWPKANPFGTTYYRFLQIWFRHSDHGPILKFEKRKEFEALLDRYSHTPSEDDWEELEKAKGITHRRYMVEEYEPTAHQKSQLQRLRSRMEIDDHELWSAGACWQIGQQLCSGFYYHPETKIPVWEPGDTYPKLNLLTTVLDVLFTEQALRQIIIWIKYVAERTLIQQHLSTHNYRNVIGPDENALSKFMNHGVRILLMPADISEGFDELSGADTNIFYSNTASQEKRNQAEGRIDRPNDGTPRDTILHIDLVGKDMPDADIATLLQAKNFTPARMNYTVNEFTHGKGKDEHREET